MDAKRLEAGSGAPSTSFECFRQIQNGFPRQCTVEALGSSEVARGGERLTPRFRCTSGAKLRLAVAEKLEVIEPHIERA